MSLDSASWELHQYSRRMCGPMKNPKVETRSRESNSGPHDCKAVALPHDHGHHKKEYISDSRKSLVAYQRDGFYRQAKVLQCKLNRISRPEILQC